MSQVSSISDLQCFTDGSCTALAKCKINCGSSSEVVLRNIPKPCTLSLEEGKQEVLMVSTPCCELRLEGPRHTARVRHCRARNHPPESRTQRRLSTPMCSSKTPLLPHLPLLVHRSSSLIGLCSVGGALQTVLQTVAVYPNMSFTSITRVFTGTRIPAQAKARCNVKR